MKYANEMNLAPICEPTVENVGASTSHNLVNLHGP
jgi:hypothetical protein